MLNYQVILLNHFESYLASIGSSVRTQKNYRSDLFHLFTWISSETSLISHTKIAEPEHIISLLTPSLLHQYRQSLIDSNTPKATINRRLSSIRMFCEYCKQYGLMSDNPAKSLSNVPDRLLEEDYQKILLKEFEKNLLSEGASKKTISNYVNDVKQFLFWLDPTGS